MESIIEVQPEFGDSSRFVHAEVYTDNTATTMAPAVESLEAIGLFYEPVLFITDAAGVVLERIDAVWNNGVESEPKRPEPGGQLKLWPHPQVREALGFVMANPDWSRPSL